MKMNVMKQILLTAIIVFTGIAAQAQCSGWNWPEDATKRSEAETKNVLYSDALTANNYKEAEKHLTWLLENTPGLNTSIYINGEKIYNGLIKEETDEDLKNGYIESLLNIYDMRIENCNEEAEVMARKAYAAYRYNVKKPDELKNILDLFKEAKDLNGKDMPDYMLLPYMSVVYYNVKYLDNLSPDEILEYYDAITETLDYKIANESDAAKRSKLVDYKNKIDGFFVQIFDVDCDYVKEKLEPRFRANPEDIKLAKTIFKFMLEGKCTDDPLWLEAGKVIADNDPSYGLFKNLGLKAKSNDNNAEAEELFNKALEYAQTPAEKSEMLLQLGSNKAEQGQKSAARQLFKQALAADPSAKEAYTRIGYLYFTSYEQCKGGEDMVKDRGVFLAAYDYFMRAGNSKAAGDAKEQFPSKEEIFTYNYNAGDEISIGCWIGETTTIRTRD
jgi:tetratricopeptide (TPR) repeat protein